MSQHGDPQRDNLLNTDEALPHLLAPRRRGALSSAALAYSIILRIDSFIQHCLWHRLRHGSRALLARRTAFRRVCRTRALGKAGIYTSAARTQKESPQAHAIPNDPATASLRRPGNSLPVRSIPIPNRPRVSTDLSPVIPPARQRRLSSSLQSTRFAAALGDLAAVGSVVGRSAGIEFRRDSRGVPDGGMCCQGGCRGYDGTDSRGGRSVRPDVLQVSGMPARPQTTHVCSTTWTR